MAECKLLETGQGPCRANLHKWGLTQSPSCDCGQRQTMNHIVDTSPLKNIWRWTESNPWSGWWRSHMAGIYSDCSTRKIVIIDLDGDDNGAFRGRLNHAGVQRGRLKLWPIIVDVCQSDCHICRRHFPGLHVFCYHLYTNRPAGEWTHRNYLKIFS